MKLNGNFKNLDIIINIFYENLNNKWSVKGFEINEKQLKKMQDKELSILKDILDGKFSEQTFGRAWGIKITMPKEYKYAFDEINRSSKKEREEAYLTWNYEPWTTWVKKYKDDWTDITFANYKKNNNTTRLSLKEGDVEIISNISNSYNTRTNF